MTETIVKYNDSKRLVYLEPNAITTENGVPVTPDYTDYCIMFKLMADVVNRMDVIGVDGSSNLNEKIAITWISDNKNGKGEKVYFTRGSKIDDSDKSYLTTYYTSVKHSDLSDKDVIEGLGVESIDIGIENFYAATVKIRFVDVRGYSLFGREEAIHTNTHLTANDIYGCFFSMPYPKFSLQVKGYYGKAMTLQLTCIDFRGTFDSNTGNFIADVSFIGYDFSCFSDLPLRYVVLSSCDNETGRKYSDDNAKNNKNWQLIGPDGPEEPQRLIDVYKNIKNAVNGSVEFNVNDYIEDTSIIEVRNEIEKISKLKIEYDTIIQKCISDNLNRNYNFNVEKIDFTEFDEEGKEEGFDGYTEFHISSKDSYLKNFSEVLQPDFTLLFNSLSEYNKTSDDIVFDFKKENFTFKEDSFSYSDTNIYLKTFVFDDGGLYGQIINNLNELTVELENSPTPELNTGSTKKIKDILKFTPYIGNVIKLILCHVETFIYTVYATASNIYNEMNVGNRSAKDLGITVKNSDISRLSVLNIQRFATENTQVPPFPSIVVTDKCTDKEMENTFGFERNGWPGDFGELRDKWQEYKLVKGYADASQRKSSEETKKTNDIVSEDLNDLLSASYLFFKALWDRWLVSNTPKDFSVEKLYEKFVFVNSYFKSIEYKMHINVDILMSCIENKNSQSTIFTLLRDLANKHNCMLFSYSDTISFTTGYSRNNNAAKRCIEKIFTPIPFKDIEEIPTENKIVFMYHNKPSSSSNSGFDDFTDDNMYFSDGEKLTEFTNKAFESSNKGYIVPSFCVTYSKLSNTFFTNFSINMDVPTVTSETIATMSDISERYSASKRKVTFYGQDLFPVFSNYSFICEFDMLGDVQITPLMYFQLFNIPMFRGVYMIFSVRHTMKQGEMITHVKGMRMSKHTIPLPKRWFSDSVEELFRKYGITGQKVIYGSTEEISIKDICKRYKKLDKEGVVDLVIEINGGYYSNSKERVFGGNDDMDCYCNIKNISTNDDEDYNAFWDEIKNEVINNNLKETEVSNNPIIVNYVKDYYTKKYDDLKLDGINDPYIETLIMVHASVFQENVTACYEAANNVLSTNYETSEIYSSLNEDIKNKINDSDKAKYATELAKCMKKTYAQKKGEVLRMHLLEMVDECIEKINEKCC